MVNLFLSSHKRKLKDHLDLLPKGELLDVGVGSGEMLPLYSEHTVTGIDLSEKMLEVAEKKNGHGAKLLIMDGQEMSFNDGAFDIAVLCHTLSVTANPTLLLNEVVRVLKPGGHLLVLNHFSRPGMLSWIDKIISPLVRAFHFKTYFSNEVVLNYSNLEEVTVEYLGFLKTYQIIVLKK
ncbi:MAG: class I SAM-dependent methyltransferase [Flavobacteriales bacterium]|nr:class I SAM-dependent methyltransferase [Flavobacteriales bacterium]